MTESEWAVSEILPVDEAWVSEKDTSTHYSVTTRCLVNWDADPSAGMEAANDDQRPPLPATW